MKLWKRSGIVLLFALALALLCLHGSCSAKVQRGTWKKNTRWEFDTRTKTLTISCRGKMEESVSCMGKFPGWDSTKVKKVVFRPGITYVGDMNMDYPKLEEVVLPEGLIYIGDPFGKCPRLKKLRLPSTLRRLGLMAFEEADNLQSVTMPGVEKIGNYAFLGCNLKSLTLPDTCRRIGRGAFENTRIRSVTIPSGVKKIGKWTFAYIKNLKSVTIRPGVEIIGKEAFVGTGLETVTIPSSVTTLGSRAFYGEKDSREEDKTHLKRVTIKSKKIREWGEEIFGIRKDLVIEVPESKREEYTRELRKGGLPEYVKIVGKKM